MSRTITSLLGYTRKIREVVPTPSEVLAYRGHSDHHYKLHPSVLRRPVLAEAEHAMLRELVASHPAEFFQDGTTLERLARAQHYALPTRLLDVTWNPLVALYFAVNGRAGTSGEVVVLRVNKSRVKFFDSDLVSCLANLAHLKPAERAAIDFALPIAAFNAQAPVDRLLQFIRAEKPHFRSQIVPGDLKSVVCVKPKRNSQRILVQSGAFLLFGISDALDEAPADGIGVVRIRVNGKHKREILKELDRMAINESSLFPEIENAAKYIRARA